NTTSFNDNTSCDTINKNNDNMEIQNSNTGPKKNSNINTKKPLSIKKLSHNINSPTKTVNSSPINDIDCLHKVVDDTTTTTKNSEKPLRRSKRIRTVKNAPR